LLASGATMLLAFFGTVEFCSAVAVDRKVTLIARTLSDLTSQAGAPITDTYIQNIFTAGIAIMMPYTSSPATATISQIYVDSHGNATIQWSKAATFATGASQATLTNSARNPGDNMTTVVPPALLVKQTYLILSEVGYQYVPTIGYVMAKAGVHLGDVSYTRPRQLVCVIYDNQPVTPPASCPLT
jgi:Flp pilus assembly protein TadG